MYSKVYTQEHEDQINRSVLHLVQYLEGEFPYHVLMIKEKSPDLKCVERESYVNFSLSYNLILALLIKLLEVASSEERHAIRSMLESDLSEFIDGPFTQEQWEEAAKAMNDKKNRAE